MNYVLVKDEQLKFLVAGDLREQLDKVFEAQGVSMKEGMGRLIQFLVTQPEELHPLILGQIRGAGAKDVARALLARLVTEEPNGHRRTGGNTHTVRTTKGVQRHGPSPAPAALPERASGAATGSSPRSE